MPNHYINPEIKTLNILRIHLICWSVYIFYELIVAGIITGHFSNPLYYLLYYGLNIGLFYGHKKLVLEPSIGKPGSAWKLPLLLLIEICLYLAFSIAIAMIMEALKIRRNPTVFNGSFFIASLYRAFLFMIFSTGYYFLSSHILRRNSKLKGEIENEKLRAELVTLQRDFLRSQINPHLLFNTLTFIKNSVVKNPGEADDAILRLSDIMSFAMERDLEGFAPLSKELQQMENIIQLNQLRYAHRLNLSLHINIHDESVFTLPIILLTLVENVFKHGNLLDREHPAVIEVNTSEEKISYLTRNLVGGQMIKQRDFEGTGLTNVRQRLESQFPEKHLFDLQSDGVFFEVKIEFGVQSLAEDYV